MRHAIARYLFIAGVVASLGLAACSTNGGTPLALGGGNNGTFSLSCFGGKFSGNGGYQSKNGAPNDHIVGQGKTASGQPVVLVIGLPSQLAAGTYGGL